MLDKIKLAKELERIATELFADSTQHYALLQKIWQKISNNEHFAHKVAQLYDAPWPVPTWLLEHSLSDVIPVATIEPYTVVSVDGSQVYPDRHQGFSCFLINIGTVTLAYNAHTKPVILQSTPHLFSGNDMQDGDRSAEFVNCLRHELELKYGLQLLQQVSDPQQSLLLIDGSLIFWHLEAQGLKERFLDIYLLLLLRFYQEKLPLAGYISAPKSKELVNLIRLQLCNFDTDNKTSYEVTNNITDATIVNFFLPEAHRTILFKNRSNISQVYPVSIHPYFFYINVGQEIGRVEIPAWIAQDKELVDRVASIVLDQSIKGRGYPVVVAEAHEQAVVKGPDRELFYHLLRKMSVDQQRKVPTSLKSQKKLRMGI